MRFETRAVLGGMYKGKRASLEGARTHTVEVDDAEDDVRAMCGKVDVDHFADVFAEDPNAPPTCPRCAAKDPRFKDGHGRA